MAIVKQWDGSGVAYGTVVSTSVTGTGDTAFNISNATPTWNNTGPLAIGEVGISNATEQDRVGWSGLGTLANWAVQMYVSMDGLPNIIKQFIKVSDNTATAITYVGWNSSGQFQHRTAANSATSNSTTPAIATLYRIAVYGSTGSSTIHVRVYKDSDNSLFWSADPDTGSTAAVDRVEFGRQDGSTYGAVVRFSHFSVWNTAVDPGQYPYSTPITNTRSWQGAGVADSTVMTTAVVGTGDSTFTTVGGTPTPTFFSTNSEIRVINTSAIQNVTWDNYDWAGAWSVQFYVRWDVQPSAISHFIYATDAATDKVFTLSTNSSGQMQLRRQDNTAVSTSANPIIANTRYCVQVWGTAGSAVVNVRVYPYGTTNAFFSTTQNVTNTNVPNSLKFGRQSSTLYGAQLFMSHFKTGEVSGALARYESVSGTPAGPNTRAWVGPAADDPSLILTDKGTSDTAFDIISGAPAFTVATHTITIPNSSTITNVQWTGLTWTTNWSVRMILNWDAQPTATSHVLYARDTAGTLLWSISVNSSGHYAVRNNTGTAVKTSSYTIIPGDNMRLSVYGTAGDAVIHVRLQDMADTVLWTEDTSITATTIPGQFLFGRQSSTLYGAVVHIGYFATDEIAGVIPSDPSLFPIQWWHVPDVQVNNRIPLNLFGYKPLGSNTIVSLSTAVSTWTYVPPSLSVAAADYPFDPTSIWKTSVGTGTSYEAANTGATATMVNHTYGKVINVTSWTYPVYKATLSDPQISIYSVTYNTQVSPWTITAKGALFGTYRIPWAATWVNISNTDRPVMVVQPDGVTVVEIYKFGWYDSSNVATSSPSTASGPWVATTYPNVNDLRGHGLRAGSQASGVSQMAGLLRKHEVLSGEIKHILKGSMPAAMLKATPVDADGTVSWSGNPNRAQAVFPARLQDTQVGANIYSGNISMGSIFCIPQSIDIDATFPSINANGKRLLRALQNYGWCALVQSSTVAIFAEGGSNASIVTNDMGPAWKAAQPYLRRISNNFAGDLDANRVPIDPSGLMGGGTRLVGLQEPLTEGTI
ncbi:MAG: hypothetical protein ACOH18_04570 [Candidatus Saccharimonadaceae bacterium]